MAQDLPIRYLREEIYPMASHHRTEIERALRLRGEATSKKLLAAAKNVKIVFLCFTNRVGSNHLTDLLSLAGYGVRVAEEDFNSSTVLASAKAHKLQEFDAYLERQLNATKKNGTCVWKIGAAQLLWLANRGFVPDFFSQAGYLFLRRRDKIAQAVSLYKANKTGQYVGGPANGEEPELEFDKEQIARALFDILRWEFHFSYFFELHGIKPFELWYEDLVADPRSSIQQVSDWLGCGEAPWLDIDAVDSSRFFIKKQSTKENGRVMEEMREAFALTPAKK
jgi:LPS sulfotransferase NodH